MNFVYNDGGRLMAGYKGHAADCVVRAIATATHTPYQEVYDDLATIAKHEHKGKRKVGKSSPRTGVYRYTYENYLKAIGWTWTPTMFIGQGCKVHLCTDELPAGWLIVKVSHHLTAVCDGTLYDTHNVAREGKRCVYGYWKKGA